MFSRRVRESFLKKFSMRGISQPTFPSYFSQSNQPELQADFHPFFTSNFRETILTLSKASRCGPDTIAH
jgi:hypothetical protein